MNAWLIAAVAMLIGLVPCGLVCLRATPMERLVALQMASVVDTLVLLVLAEGMHRAPFFDMALILALMSFAGVWPSPASWSAGCERPPDHRGPPPCRRRRR